MNRPIPLTIPGMLLLHAKGPQRKEQRPGTEDSQAWLPAGSLVGPGIGEHDDRAAEKAWAGKKSEKSAGLRPRRSLSGIPILSSARPLRHRPCRPFSAAALSALALALQRNRHPVLTIRFRDEKLLFRQSRWCDGVKLVEKVTNAPSFVTIGQELPKI